MKSINIALILVVSCLLISISSCNHVAKSGEIGDQFYSYLQEKDYSSIIQLLDNEALKNYSSEEWLELFTARNQYFGELKSYKPVSFHTETIKNTKIIHLTYQVINSDGLVNEEIELIDRGKHLKILNYHFSYDIASTAK